MKLMYGCSSSMHFSRFIADAAADSANRRDGASGLSRGQMKLLVYTLVPMDDTPNGLTDTLYWRRTRGEWHGFKRSLPRRIYLALPAPGNQLRARAEHLPPRGCSALRVV
jgi:hypothetical protein